MVQYHRVSQGVTFYFTRKESIDGAECKFLGLVGAVS